MDEKDLNVEELKKYIYNLEQELKNTKKYGLVWDRENTTEEVILECKTKIPVLIEEFKKRINTAGDINSVLIEGDNYHSLLSLKMINYSPIDVIYIDPPYNTGNKDFCFNDNFIDRDDGFRHSKWLSFMKKRLELAKSLLSIDGVIFISIDDHELHNLKLLCDSIFGERNFITQFVWEKTQHFGRQKINFYSNCEYVLCYARNLYDSDTGKIKELLVEKIKSNLTDAPLYNASNRLNELVFPAKSVKFNLKDGIYSVTENSLYKLLEPVKVVDSLNVTPLKLQFKSRWSQETIDKEIENGTSFWVKSKGFAIRAIYNDSKTSKESPKQLIFTNSNNSLCTYSRFSNKVGVNEEGTSELNNLLNQNLFSYPKPTSLIKYLLSLYFDYKNNKHHTNFTVLDFFAGSGTTGQAVMELNKEDGGKRKFILCTNNENNICSDVCYPRLKTIITGIRPNGSKYGEKINTNLFYFKTDFVTDKLNRDQAKYSLVAKCNGLFSLLEDCFELKEERPSWFRYTSKTKDLFIFNDLYSQETFDEMKSYIFNSNKDCVLYVFSIDENADFVDLTGMDNVTIKPIPTKIYEIYKEIVEGIKRGG